MTHTWTSIPKSTASVWTAIPKPPTTSSIATFTGGTPIGLLLALTQSTTSVITGGDNWTRISKASGQTWTAIIKAT